MDLPDPEARPELFSSTAQEGLCVVMLAFAPIMNSANQGAMQLALPHVSKSFNIDGGQLSWTITSYSLVTGSTMLVMGRLSDILGRKRMLLFAFSWYTIFSLILGFMKSDIVFDVMRGLQALAGATAPSAAAGTLGTIYPNGRRKNKAMATFAAGAPLGAILGLVVSGICTQFISWRANLFFFAIVYAFLTVGIFFLLPSDEACAIYANKIIAVVGGTPLIVKRDWRTSWGLIKELDYLGVVLSTSGLILFIYSIAGASSAPDGWGTSYIIALLVVGAVLICSFVVWEHYAPRPLMPLFIWKKKGFALCMITVACGWMDFQGVLIYFASLTFQHINGYTPILTTAAMMPQTVSGIIVNIIAAFVLHRVPGRILMIIAMSAFVIAALLWALNPLDLTYWAMTFPALAIVVVGADLAYNVANQFSLSCVTPQYKSTAAGIFNVMTQVASTIGVAASTAIVTSQIGPDIENQDRAILHRGYRCAYWFAVGMGGVGLICSFFLKVGTQGGKDSRPVPKKVETEPVEVDESGESNPPAQALTEKKSSTEKQTAV